MIVMKFGGSSVESKAAVERVAGIVRAQESRRPIVVVSAMGKTTNKLLAAASEAAQGRREQALGLIEEIRAHHLRDGLALAGPHSAELDRYIRAHCEWLDELVRGIAVVGELSPRSTDAIASVGERLSSLVVSFAFRAAGIHSQHVDSRSVIVTDDQYTRAAPLLDETYRRLRETVRPIAESAVVVMGGFIGATVSGQTTTLGRGGSDYSAAIVGAGVDAGEIQIWTDVDGMLTADPTVLAGGHRVRTCSFDEAAELAFFGAKVLHPATVVPAVEKNIPVLILNSRNPAVEGTRIVAHEVDSKNVAKSIASKKNVTLINVTSSRMLMAHGFLRRIFEVFDRHSTPVDMLATSEVSVSLTVDQPAHLAAIRHELEQFAQVAVENNQSIICLVGGNIRFTPGVAGRVFSALGDINIRMISQGASRLNIGFVVAQDDLPRATALLHQEFFSEVDPEVFA